jgi:agmatinase
MENLLLHTSMVSGFSGYSKSLEDSKYVIVGVPYDYTSSYRAGSRFAPRAIREASLNIETYSFETGINVEDVPLHDVGDLHVVDDATDTLSRLERVVRDILSADKMPICVGGEHTITLGAVRSLPKDMGIVSFDAHGDLRDEYGGGKISHATVLRRITELVGTDRVCVCGIRAMCREEVEFIRREKILCVTPKDIRKIGMEKTRNQLESFLDKFRHTYLTIDSDVLDPAFCPGVANPEFNGLTPDELLPLVSIVAEQRMIGFDLVEVCPTYDTGTAPVAAARLIFETLAHAEKVRLGTKPN